MPKTEAERILVVPTYLKYPSAHEEPITVPSADIIKNSVGYQILYGTMH
jgi:hypothetical protein